MRIFWYKDLPEGFMQTFGDFICYRKRLKNGWQAVKISNGTMFFLHSVHEDFNIPMVKKITVAKDGKFSILNNEGETIVYAPNGKPLTPFNEYSKLFHNGWYSYMAEDGIRLYDADFKLIGEKLTFTHVFKCGTYVRCVKPDGDTLLAGVFSKENKRLLFTNSSKVKVLKNGWFITENSLYDDQGNLFIEPLCSRKVPNWLLYVVGSMMSSTKN